MAVALLIIGIALMLPVNVQENYGATEKYTEKEPYDAIETYYVKEPYTAYVPLNYTIVDHIHFDLIHRAFYTRDDVISRNWLSGCDVSVIVKNTDNVGGDFWVTLYAATSTGSYECTTDAVFLKGGDRHEFLCTFQGDYNSSTYVVHRATKEVIEYRDVPKERMVTKYHDVIKERTVLKTKIVQKPIYEIIHSFLS
ncbi:MAG: hypothetical protein PHD13_02295 [Methanocellales archaeon]|nr:hypothetical protein [Methanocellales archaeon]MDD3291104.1 hypothetical protein [Methanocellales archaeon]MDD5234989.1 hypothetical protein [Methanocellales archaeon]MDD5484640.1 hypothetical protein [Methanocellales archaeon]